MRQEQTRADRTAASLPRNAVGMSLLQTHGNSRGASIRLPRRHRCSQIPPAVAGVSPRVAGLQCSKRAAAQPIEPCHVERSETSLTIGLASRLKDTTRDPSLLSESQEESVSVANMT